MSGNKPVTLEEIDEMRTYPRVHWPSFERLAESYRNLVEAAQPFVERNELRYEGSKRAWFYRNRLRAALPEEPEEGAGR